MSVKTVGKRRKRSWSLYLMLCKGRYKTWITSNEALFHLSFTTGKTRIQYISRKKRHKDAAVLQKASWPSGIMTYITMDLEMMVGPEWDSNEGSELLELSRYNLRIDEFPTKPRFSRVLDMSG
ncbi:hypothetical protein TNCV_2495191 [Trichonephila clavipes]|nr:hypothetical protein TNCV_2495191 [Trichonephila clavipes]